MTPERKAAEYSVRRLQEYATSHGWDDFALWWQRNLQAYLKYAGFYDLAEYASR